MPGTRELGRSQQKHLIHTSGHKGKAKIRPLVRNIRRFGVAFAALVLILNVSESTPAVSAQASVEQDFMTILNGERTALGKSPLTINSSLSTAAYLHSKDMAENGYFSHTSLDGRTFVQRIVAAGYTNYYSLGENIAYHYGSPDAARVYDMWKNSSGHYANMMGNFAEAGLGVYYQNNRTYYTLDLGRSSNPVPPADFSLSVSPSTRGIEAGSSADTTITVTSVNGFSGTVALTPVSFPDGWTATINPISLAVASGDSEPAVLSITVPSTAQAGAHTVTARGTSGSINHTVMVTVNVPQASALEVDINDDGLVNVLDMARVGQHWGETGPGGWIAEDINRDGNVNVLDIILIGQHWTR